MAQRAFKEKMKEIHERLLYMSRLAREMVTLSVEGLKQRDPAILAHVMEAEEKVNHLEIEIDEKCITTLALYQPEAGDLRTLVMMLKINNDLERIGDHAVNIAQHASVLIQHPPVKPLIDIPRMQEISCDMLDNAFHAFTYADAPIAHKVCENDDIVDELRNQIIRELLTYMMENPKIIDDALRLILISRDLERIADLSTNIAEDVIYMVEGVSIKHHVLEEEPGHTNS